MASPVVVSRIQNRRGLQAQFDALYPPGYNGIGGYGSLPGFNATAYPDVLLPGEMALCTDSRRLFTGNLNAEYIEFTAGAVLADIILQPLVLVLPPAGVPTATGISFPITPFFTILYDLTDSPLANWNIPGTNFSRNGKLEITALAASATLTDTGTEINLDAPDSITFTAAIVGPDVVINYVHDFSTSLTFSSSSVKWLPF